MLKTLLLTTYSSAAEKKIGENHRRKLIKM